MKTITKYVCEHCGREYRIKKNAEHHESICWKNKALKACHSCKFYGGIDTDMEGFNRYDYIVCHNQNYTDGPDGIIPITNCEYWEEETRTKKLK